MILWLHPDTWRCHWDAGKKKWLNRVWQWGHNQLCVAFKLYWFILDTEKNSHVYASRSLRIKSFFLPLFENKKLKLVMRTQMGIGKYMCVCMMKQSGKAFYMCSVGSTSLGWDEGQTCVRKTCWNFEDKVIEFIAILILKNTNTFSLHIAFYFHSNLKKLDPTDVILTNVSLKNFSTVLNAIIHPTHTHTHVHVFIEF